MSSRVGSEEATSRRPIQLVLIQHDSVIVHVHDFLDASPRFELFDVRAERALDPSELV